MNFYNLFSVKLQKFYSQTRDKVLESNQSLNDEELSKISELIENIDRYINYCERLKLKYGQILDYNNLKLNGFTTAEIEEFYQEDRDYIQNIDQYYKNNIAKKDYMFGYPANMQNYSYTSQYLRGIESKIYLMNNCGDPYQIGNYGMDSKDIEKQIISLFAKNFGLKDNTYWGYITSGGTESNFWAIREGFLKYPNGKMYFSSEAHYSIEKFITNNGKKIYEYEIIESNRDGSINKEKLISKINEDVKKGIDGVILVLSWGTTCSGAIDDVKYITSYLIKNKINYYCHLDSALYGGIPQNQKDAPCLKNVNDLNIDSMSISLHKYIGTSRVNGVIMALSRQNRKIIDYIGQEDSTLLGSRDYMAFSTLQRAKEILERTDCDKYRSNIIFIKNLFEIKNISYSQFDKGNIFVIDKPSDWICKKYQLATFKDNKLKEKAHIIIFPFHKQHIIEELIFDIVNDKKEKQ